MLKWLITIEHSEGVGENKEQFITRMSIFLGSVLVLFSKSAMIVNITNSLSFLAASADRSAGFPSKHWTVPGGHAVEGPQPLWLNIRDRNSIDSSEKHPWLLIIVNNCSAVNFQLLGGSKVLKSIKYTGFSLYVKYQIIIATIVIVFHPKSKTKGLSSWIITTSVE